MGYEEQKQLRERSSRIVLLLVINDISEYKRLCSEHKRGSTADSAYTELHASLFSPCSEASEADAADGRSQWRRLTDVNLISFPMQFQNVASTVGWIPMNFATDIQAAPEEKSY